jgi:ribosome biogenesis protein YTM1
MQNQRLYVSHTDWISAVAWHPISEKHVVTASYDKTVKLWDLRAGVPLHTLQGHTDKVLCVAWAGPEKLVSGGADCTSRTYSIAI